MNEIVLAPDAPIKVNQCLFGYQDGHRLLASSIQLPSEAASQLLLQSDLAPGVNLPAQGGYWTGIPLPSAKSYALMRTWLAPEMSRPGCVWTHALVVAFADIGRFTDLSVLVDSVVRPSGSGGLEGYEQPISLRLSSYKARLKKNADGQGVDVVHRVVKAIYADQDGGKIVAPLGILDNAIFAAWSQQWPRLRRNFSFRTAVSINENFALTKRFDLSVLIGFQSEKIDNRDSEGEVSEAWEHICVDDLLLPHGTDLRRFLWRYGSDVRYGQKRFRFLVNIYLSTRSPRLSGKKLRQVLSDVTRVLSSPEDGRVLKEDLVSQNVYSLLPPADLLDVLAFYVDDPMALNLPVLPENSFEAIRDHWPDRAEEILAIAERAAERETEPGAKLMNRLAATANASTFLSSTVSRPTLRQKLLMLNPSLLDSDDLVNVPHDDLLRFIEVLPENDHLLVGRLVQRMTAIDDKVLAETITSRFPKLTILAVVGASNQFMAGRGSIVQNPWIRALEGHAHEILESGIVERAQTTSTLSLLAFLLGYAQPITLEAGPIPWAEGLKYARDDLDGFDRQRFLVFLLEIALHTPKSGCEILFEFSFNTIHADLKLSRLGWEQTTRLLHVLPDLGWFENWDSCLRLKTGVVNAYVSNNLDEKSFKRLTKDVDLYDELLALVSDSPDGRKFRKKIR